MTDRCMKNRTVQPLLFGGYESGPSLPRKYGGEWFGPEFWHKSTARRRRAFGCFVPRGRILPLNVAEEEDKEKGGAENARLPSDRQAAARPSKRGESGKGARRAFLSFSAVLAKVQ